LGERTLHARHHEVVEEALLHGEGGRHVGEVERDVGVMCLDIGDDAPDEALVAVALGLAHRLCTGEEEAPRLLKGGEERLRQRDAQALAEGDGRGVEGPHQVGVLLLSQTPLGEVLLLNGGEHLPREPILPAEDRGMELALHLGGVVVRILLEGEGIMTGEGGERAVVGEAPLHLAALHRGTEDLIKLSLRRAHRHGEGERGDLGELVVEAVDAIVELLAVPVPDHHPDGEG